MMLNGVKLSTDYGDPAAEARACRNTCALFDFSFIRCARFEGKKARITVEGFASRSLKALSEGRIVYAVRADANGYALSDLTIWKTGADSFEVMSGRGEDIAEFLKKSLPDVHVSDVSEDRQTLAVQGPLALEALLDAGAPVDIKSLTYFSFRRIVLGGTPCVVGRLGYTGEAGFEIIACRSDIPKLWKKFASLARPAGFIAADALRIEAGFVLFTNEFLLPVSPSEAGLGKFYSGPTPSKLELKRVTFQAEAGEIRQLPWLPQGHLPRPSKAGEIIVTSACRSVVGRKIIGFGYTPVATRENAALSDPSGSFRNISQLHTPFYDAQKSRPREDWDRAISG